MYFNLREILFVPVLRKIWGNFYTIQGIKSKIFLCDLVADFVCILERVDILNSWMVAGVLQQVWKYKGTVFTSRYD